MADTTLCLTCFSSCYKTTIPSGTSDVIYKRTHSEWGVNDEVQWWFLENDIWNEVTDTADLAALNALDDTSKVSCDAIGGGTAGCTPKSKSETVTINCDSVTGVTDNGNGTYTWTHGLALTDFANVLFTPYAVISSDANSVTFESDACLGSFNVSLLALGAADCAPTSGGGGGTTTLEAENGLHVHDGKAHLGGELIEDTTIDLMELYYNLKGQSSDYVKSFTKEMNFEEYMAQWNNDDLLRSLTIVEKAQLFKVLASGEGTNGIPNEAEMSVVMEGIRFRLVGEASFKVANQSGIYEFANVPLDQNNEAEYNLVIKADGTVLKNLNNRQDGSVCYSSTDSPTNFVFQLPKTPINNAAIDALVSGTATGYISQTDYASFTNTGYTADAAYFDYEYIKSAATQLVGATPNVKLQTLYMPNLTSVVDPACFATVTGQKMTVIVPIAMQTDPAFVALAANNTVTFLDSAALSGGVGFKKVISNRAVRYFNSAGVEVTDLAVIAAYEAYIKSFAVFATNCSAGGSTTSLQPVQQEFTATASQTSFTLSSTAHSFLGGYVNGVLVPFSAFTVSGTTATYTASANDNHVFVGGERVQIMYNKTI